MPQKNNSDFTRRKFLSTTAVGLASAGILNLAPAGTLAQAEGEETEAGAGKVIYRKLGRTGLDVPIVSMGVMNAGQPEIVAASYEAGIRHFDTAAYYQFGRNEQMLGSVINRLGVRDEVIIGTKVFTARQREGLVPSEVTGKLVDACDASLRRLGMDYVDILYIHSVSDPETVADKNLIEGLKELKRQKKIRFAGVATHTRMDEVISEAARGGFYDVVLTAINFTMADDTALMSAIKIAADAGVGIVAMKTLAGGSRWPNPQSRKDYTSSTIATAAIKWVMRNENIATCIPGFNNFEHMKEDFSVASGLAFTAQENKFLSDNSIKLGMGFCRQCRKCLASCPDGVEVPTLMRTHMYAAQYANFQQARATLDEIPAGNGLKVCTDCSNCQAKCANTVDIARRIDELKMMYC